MFTPFQKQQGPGVPVRPLRESSAKLTPGRYLFPTLLVLVLVVRTNAAEPFEGRMNITLSRGSQTNSLLYTVGPEHLRIEVSGASPAYAVDIFELSSGAMTLIYPHNRSFVQLKQPPPPTPPDRSSVPGFPPAMPLPNIGPNPSAATNFPAMPALPAGLPAGVGPQAGAGVSAGVAPMPAMKFNRMPGQKLELKAVGETTILFGLACRKYEITSQHQTMEIWATDQLLPYQPYVARQTPRFGPSRLDDSWAKLLADRKLFPIQATLHDEIGQERFHFEVTAVSPETVSEPDDTLFQPPADYHEVRPLPF